MRCSAIRCISSRRMKGVPERTNLSQNTSPILRIVAELECPLCAVGRSGLIREANAAFAALVGSTPDALRARSLFTLLPASDAAVVEERLRDYAAALTALPTALGL